MDWLPPGVLLWHSLYSNHHEHDVVSLTGLDGCRPLIINPQPFRVVVQNVQPRLAGQPTGPALLCCRADNKFGGGKKNSEDFNTCGRTIKTGLIAVGECRTTSYGSGIGGSAAAGSPALSPVKPLLDTFSHGVTHDFVLWGADIVSHWTWAGELQGDAVYRLFCNTYSRFWQNRSADAFIHAVDRFAC